jgi:hypothetical protein
MLWGGETVMRPSLGHKRQQSLEASVPLHQTTRCHTPEDNTLHSLEKLKSHINCDFHVRSNLAELVSDVVKKGAH